MAFCDCPIYNRQTPATPVSSGRNTGIMIYHLFSNAPTFRFLLEVNKFFVFPRNGCRFGVSPLLCNFSVVNDKNLIGLLVFGVDTGSCFLQNDDGDIFLNGAGNGNALLFFRRLL